MSLSVPLKKKIVGWKELTRQLLENSSGESFALSPSSSSSASGHRMTRVLSHCGRSPCRESTANPSSHNWCDRSPHEIFFAVKTMTVGWCGSGSFDSRAPSAAPGRSRSPFRVVFDVRRCKISASLLILSCSSTNTRCCRMSLLATNRSTSLTVILIGARRKSWASLWISFGHVAEYSKVCQTLGT